MEKILIIDGREVGFKSSGATMSVYRKKFRDENGRPRDFFDDFQTVSADIAKNGGALAGGSLQLFENLAYTMAYQYDHSIPEDPDDWLDGFGIFSIYQILPQLMELLNLNMLQAEEPKKKDEEQSAG